MSDEAQGVAGFGPVVNRLLQACLRAAIVLVGVIVAGQIVIVLLRYGVRTGSLALQDLVSYSFALLICLAVPLAMGSERHVRVDVFRQGMAPRPGRWIERLGMLLLAIPAFAMIGALAWPLLAESWRVREGSAETGGLPGLFLVRSGILVMAALIILQALLAVLSPDQRHTGRSGADER